MNALQKASRAPERGQRITGIAEPLIAHTALNVSNVFKRVPPRAMQMRWHTTHAVMRKQGTHKLRRRRRRTTLAPHTLHTRTHTHTRTRTRTRTHARARARTHTHTQPEPIHERARMVDKCGCYSARTAVLKAVADGCGALTAGCAPHTLQRAPGDALATWLCVLRLAATELMPR